MKSFKALQILMLALLSVGLVNCGKSNKSSSTTTTSGYYVSNSICYYNGVAQASLNSCTSASGTYYAYQGSMCYQIGNGIFQQVQTTLCQNSNSGIGGSQICSGYYTDGYQTALCTEGASGVTRQNGYLVMDCSGYTLYNQNRQLVTCQ